MRFLTPCVAVTLSVICVCCARVHEATVRNSHDSPPTQAFECPNVEASQVRVTAHGGIAGAAFNTMAGFDEAQRLGADAIGVLLRYLPDGTFVILGNHALNDLLDHSGCLAAESSSEASHLVSESREIMTLTDLLYRLELPLRIEVRLAENFVSREYSNIGPCAVPDVEQVATQLAQTLLKQWLVSANASYLEGYELFVTVRTD